MLSYFKISGMSIDVVQTSRNLESIRFLGGSFQSKDAILSVPEFSIQYSCDIWSSGTQMWIYFNPNTNEFLESSVDLGFKDENGGFYIGGVKFSSRQVGKPCISSVFIPRILSREENDLFDEVFF